MADEAGNPSDTGQAEAAPSGTASKSPSPKPPTSSGGRPISKSSSKAGSTSKPGSAKSTTGSQRSGSAKSVKSTTRATSSVRSTSPKGAKGKSKGKKKDESEKSETPTVMEAEDFVLPEGAIPLFLSSQTQEIFECRADEDVTVSDPLKLLKKEIILQDLFNRAAISDFHPIKQIIQEYPEEEILVGYDADFKFGQNFYVATTEEAKAKLLRGPEVTEAEGGVEGVEQEPEEEVVYKYVPPTSKEWVSQGSEKDIEEESLCEQRKRIKMTVRRKRREFGAPCNFTDRNVGDAKDGFIECTAYDDKTFDLKRIELNKAIQAIPEFSESSSQTEWKFPRTASTQYYAREFNDEQQQDIQTSDVVEGFVKSVAPRFELALQQNEIMDVYYDDWFNLADDDSTFGSKADNHLKEYQSFTDLQFSKEKTVTHIEWHPSVRGVVAVSVGERMTFDERIDNLARVIMTPSLILIWSFSDPIHPQLLLEAPDDILCFKFSASDPNIIAGGCLNGQVVLWDIAQYAERLKQPRSKRKDNLSTLPGFEDESALDTPIVRYCAVSSIEHSHRGPITDIQWLPDHLEVNRMGVPQENKNQQCCQLMTCSTDHPSPRSGNNQSKIRRQRRLNVSDADDDEVELLRMLEEQLETYIPTEDELLDRMPGCVLFWDTRAPKSHHQPDKKKDTLKNPMGVPETFKHLDLSWKPLLKVHLYKSEPGGDHSPVKFTIAEKQGDRGALTTDIDDLVEKKPSATSTATGGFNFTGTKPGSGQKRTLRSVKTHFYIGTEDGEIVYADWMPQKDQDSGKIQTPKPDYYHTMHDGPIVTLQRSPFFKDITLCVGGFSFSIWKEGVTSGPILVSAAANKRLTSGHWSPSRPAVFYITRQDGSVDIWDLLDRTHEPSMNQSVSPTSITSIYPYMVTNNQHLLAIGDGAGTLHILEIPWSLRQPTPNELVGVANYFDREVKRRAFVVARWDFREKEKIEVESESKRNAGIAPNIQLSLEEVEMRMKIEYQAFLDEEATFLRHLGLVADDDEALPATD